MRKPWKTGSLMIFLKKKIQKIYFAHAFIKPPPLYPILNAKTEKLPTTQNPLAFN